MLYMHQWEIDEHHPVLDGVAPLTRLWHYGGNDRRLARVERLVSTFRFTSVERALQADRALCSAA